MFDDHPFKKDTGALQAVMRCPKCKGTEFDAHQNQWETWRECRKCGNKWSAGSANVAQPDFLEPVPPQGMPAPDDDLPSEQYTGAAFRDPNRNY